MARSVVAKISREGYSVNATEAYKYVALSTKEALKEKASGVSASNVAHGVTGGIPLVLMFTVNGDGTVSAASGAVVDTTNALIATKSGTQYYRIFYNKQ
jgi:hypothetical protein